MLRRLIGTMRPNAYHGHLFTPPYFEGWYVKLVDRARLERLAIIVGMSRSRAARDDHAFLQLFDGRRNEATLVRFDLGAFQASREQMDVRLDRSRLTDRWADVEVASGEERIVGHVEFEGLSRWPVTPWAPGAMGWYAWMPFMECYHGIVSMDHGLRGSLEWRGRRYDFDGGRGYLEKDWGKAFPSSWIWLQTNHFATPGTSLFGSIAPIPWIGRSFPGLLAGLLHEGRLYRFAVYTGAKSVKLRVSGARVHWVVRDRRHELELTAVRGATTALAGPSFEGMRRTVLESLDARIDLQLRRRGWGAGVVFEGSSSPAGLEVHGELTELGAVAA